MKSKKSDRQEKESYPRRPIPVPGGATPDERGRNYAMVLTSPNVAAMRIVKAAEEENLAEEIDTPGMLKMLSEQSSQITGGDLTRVENMLISQATALQALFTRLATRAMYTEHITPFEANLKMALRAQSQCRATLETLASIKNPPVVYAKQANLTSGPQQVNNNYGPSLAQGIKKTQHQLSGEDNELLSNTRTQGIKSGDDSTLEAMGEIDRAKVTGR